MTDNQALGKAGEARCVELLRARGYVANLLPTNYPTYDVQASRNGRTFLVSVKASGSAEHVRLGVRKSVERLADGDFVFAFLPLVRGAKLVSFTDGGYRLLILPAAMVRQDSLPLHDNYWRTRPAPKNSPSVIIKGYSRTAPILAVWERWITYQDAWHEVPK